MDARVFKAYMMLLFSSWLEQDRATLPNDEAKLQALAKVPAPVWLEIKNDVLALFDSNANGRLYDNRLLEISALQEKRSKAGSKGGSKTPSKTQANIVAKAYPHSHSHSHISESEIEISKERILALYHENCKSLPRVKRLSKPRQKRLNILRTENPGEQFWVDYFILVEQSDFLTGRDSAWMGCGFDWLLKEANMIKVLEGNYNRHEETIAEQGERLRNEK